MALAPLLVIGAGSQARYVIDILKTVKTQTLAGLVDIENKALGGTLINGASIRCKYADMIGLFKPSDVRVIVAYGKAQKKRVIVEELKHAGYEFVSVVSPLAYISPDAKVGQGCIINPYAVVMPNASIGDHVIVHSHCVVEHDNVIGDFVNLAPSVSLAGRVRIDEGTVVYTGAKVIPDIHIGKWSLIAAGAVVTKNVAAFDQVGGVPAKTMKRNTHD